MSKNLVEMKLDPVGRSGKDIIYICPDCNDTSGHLYVDYDKGYFNCFKCSFGGKSLGKLLRKLGIKSDFDYEELQTDYESGLDDVLGMKKRVTLGSSQEVEKVEFSYDLEVSTQWFVEHSKPLSREALSYLLERGMTIDQIKFYGIQEGVSRYGQDIRIKGKTYEGRNYSKRILVPSLIPGKGISFFVARDYTGTLTPKYLNPPKEIAFASEDVWNVNMVHSRVVLICEGVFTAITAGGNKFNAVATYGKSIAEVSNAEGVVVKSQGQKLLDKKFDIYYMCYDSDATQQSLENAKYLHDRGAKVKVVYIDPKVYGLKADANSIGYQEFLKCLASAHDYSDFLSVTLN